MTRGRKAVAALLASVVVVGAGACTAEQDPRPAPTTAPGQLRTAVSVHVVARKVEAPCGLTDGGVPGPGAGGDWCYFLDPGLEFTRAERVELVWDQSGGVAVMLTLVAADRGTYAAWTAQSVGHQIAVVVQGRVLEAPDLLTPLSGEDLQIPRETDAEARALLRRLWE
ncbi:SecDF P1 head subdomain-containing protein [Phytohabitans houttuyneae]|uniref:SecDF P1 head subdomain domain-containing protein n=1 Tax=Phytohabitans houttuyneae TaxID=1076126 RepID=A0A6V8KCY6_9ACTN|nr:hypothetical protein [Phytohabitans houttuyneae]GFJ81310.1 hypothetical protein Phou_054900 [Phytohabitans houttuyneae]